MRQTALRRLAGFAFETQAPVYDDVLPRMDVALFAGFAASGPIDVPVPIEDVTQFADVFGADLPLAYDAELGRTVYAQLAPAVRLFFANGGRRCWVLRLAGAARSTKLPLPGVAVVDDDGWHPLLLKARAPGSWADDVMLSSSLTTRRLGVLGWNRPNSTLELLGPADAIPAPGDMLRLRWTGIEAYLAVQKVVVDATQRETRGRVHMNVSGALRTFGLARVPLVPDGHARTRHGRVPARFVTDTPAQSGRATVSLSMKPRNAPQHGEIIPVRFAGREVLIAVDGVAVETAVSSPPGPAVRVSGRALWITRARPPATIPSAELLSIDVWAREASGRLQRLGGLGLGPLHPRHIERLPDDLALYGTAQIDRDTWRDVIQPRFPAAGRGTARVCIPFGVGSLPENFLAAQRSGSSALARDGLTNFKSGLFADPALADSRATTLLNDAEYLRFQAPITRELTGLHAALPLDEVTLIAAPDAAQPGWKRREVGKPQPPLKTNVDAGDSAEPDDFVDCDALPRIDPPVLEATVSGSDIELTWQSEAGAGPYVVEEATTYDWRDAAVVYSGGSDLITFSAKPAGDYYYRVRSVGGRSSDWSDGAAVRIVPGGAWRALRADEYQSSVLRDVQQLMLRFCAARRDAIAVLSLPEHYREDNTAAHARELRATREGDALGFGALYHGWLYTPDEHVAPRAVAPDGAVCGLIARRAIERGAWVAPANEALRSVIALERAAAPTRWQELLQLNVNVLRHEPRGFTVMSADTLATDEDVRPINVRRLLILLRRVAVRRGNVYVFEPNNDSFRRMVQRGFEALLGDLFQRGAFAGDRAATAFQVATDETINPPYSMDQGRFIVELRVAPSRPLAFLTLRLVQTGERVVVIGA